MWSTSEFESTSLFNENDPMLDSAINFSPESSTMYPSQIMTGTLSSANLSTEIYPGTLSSTAEKITGPSWLGGTFTVGTGSSMFSLDDHEPKSKKLRTSKHVQHSKKWHHVKEIPRNRSTTGLTDVRDRIILKRFREKSKLSNFEKKEKYIKLAGGTRIDYPSCESRYLSSQISRPKCIQPYFFHIILD